MKKLLLTLAVVFGLSGLLIAEEVTVEHLQYGYISKRGGCSKLTMEDKGKILDWIRRGVLVVNKQLVNDAGTYTWMVGDDNLEFYRKQCAPYEDIKLKENGSVLGEQ